MLKNLEKCSGCTACFNICPNQAIEMKENFEGFLYPEINLEKCTNCGLCEKVCQIDKKNENKKQKTCYAGIYNDEARKISSSGGTFVALAKYILKNNGCVVGCAFNDDYSKAQHIIISDINELGKLQGSKYLQSELNSVFSEIKKLLTNKKLVLFTGTPCQVDGLKRYLRKDYNNLITVDLVCHGVPSPKVWRKYLEKVSNGKQVESLTFRDKRATWSFISLLSYKLNDELIIERSNENLYYNAFLKNLILRKSCSTCTYTNLKRVSDITIGDFWTIEKVNKNYDDSKGTSLVFLNSSKGKKIFKEISKEFKLFKKSRLKQALKGNPVLTRNVEIHQNRDRFFENIDKKDIIENLKNELNSKFDGLILNFSYSLNNYGAILTAWALQRFFEEKNKDYRILNYVPENFYVGNEILKVKEFKKKHLKLTKKFSTLEELKELNRCCDNFVVGSDQVFRYRYMKQNAFAYLFEFCEFSKRKVAFSASLGVNTFEGEQKEKYYFEKLLKRFDYLSIREKSSVEYLKNEYDINSKHVIDPVFLIGKGSYDELLKNENQEKYKDKLVYYILDKSPLIKEVLEKIGEKLNIEIVDLNYQNTTIQDWVNAFKNAKYVLTDSFHGACFSIIFNKKFLCLSNLVRGGIRFETLANLFDIKERFVLTPEELLGVEILEKPLNYSEIESVIQEQVKNAEEFYQLAFNSKLDKASKISSELDFNFIKQNKQNSIFENQIKKSNKKLQKIFAIKNEVKNSKKRKVLMLFNKKIILRRY